MKGQWFQFAAVLCAIACVATLLWWARSFMPPDLYVGAAEGRLILLFAEPSLSNYWMRRGSGSDGPLLPVRAAEKWAEVRRGRFITAYSYRTVTGADGKPVNKPLNVTPVIDSWAGVAVASEPSSGRSLYRIIAIPLLYFAAILAVPPILWVVTTRRRSVRLRAGRCANCGYDLRASAERCPECGTAVPAPAAAQASA